MLKFTEKELEKGRKLLAQKRLTSLFFSEATYQAEILFPRQEKEALFPFLQLSEQAEVLDALCQCKNKELCEHLAALYLKAASISPPLHVRFRESFWHKLTLLCAEQFGYDPKTLKVGSDLKSFEGRDSTGQRLFVLRPLTSKGKKRLEKILFKRAVETEENSLKFSNLSIHELNLWREGRPSLALLYELSFWADLAKWWMLSQEKGEKLLVSFSGESPPLSVTCRFLDMEMECRLDASFWPRLIPSLHFIDSSLQVYSSSVGQWKALHFNQEKGAFHVEVDKKEDLSDWKKIKEEGLSIGKWLFISGRGFYSQEEDILESGFKSSDSFDIEVPKEKVDLFFEQHLKEIQKHLTQEKIHLTPLSCQYALHFDTHSNLCIESFVFEKGDLNAPYAHYFGKWLYLPHKGFYKVEEVPFKGPLLCIPKDQVTDFIKKNRLWLQGYEGFQMHVSEVESHLGYFFNDKGCLAFYAHLEFAEEKEELIDLGEWIYVKGKGFYAKVSARPGAVLQAGMEIPSEDIPHFIEDKKEELELIPHFFAYSCPLEKTGLNIDFNKEGLIEVKPEFFFSKGYSLEKVQLFGNYTYVRGEGFALIPPSARLPEHYKVSRVIDPITESYFVSYELELLYPHVLSINSKLKRPKFLHLRLHSLKRQLGLKSGQWVMELSYESDIGVLSCYTLWQSLEEEKLYLFSDAGLLFLKARQFDWLRELSKKRWIKHKSVRLSTMEFIKLTAFEEILEPSGTGAKEKTVKRLLSDFIQMKAPSSIDLTGLKSQLRTYQQTGVAWLWFLQSYGLSGLLCDEMGLGKTHQAMALIAGMKNASKDKKEKFLVVCPTSVIYHWQELIKRFLPMIQAYVFHGALRDLEHFVKGPYDLLLTSYGIIRTENKTLSKIEFSLAVFDETQVAKNEKSITYKALRSIEATMRLGLTGTPIENRLLELKTLFDLIIPGYLPNAAVFRDFFIQPIEKYRDEKKQKMLTRLIRPFLLRRKKSEVLTELPEKIEEISYCDLSQEQKELYKNVFEASKGSLLKELENKASSPVQTHIFALLSKLKQICDHPCLITKDKHEYQKHSSGKWDLFQELLEEIRDSGQKVVIFSQYLDMLDIMAMDLKEKGIMFAEIRGSTQNRRQEVERFEQDPKCEVFLGSLQAAGVGIDLIAASVVIHYDRWWNPAKENQATDRVHRMGQKRGVQVFKLVTKNTVEEHIHHLIEKKLSLASGVIQFDAHDEIKGLQRNELVELIHLIEKDIFT